MQDPKSAVMAVSALRRLDLRLTAPLCQKPHIEASHDLKMTYA
jgi:hypothetical protein